MVFFTCNHCGSSLKKNKVDKHYATECRANPSLSCIDCLKDFYGEEYKAHTKCMTEDQKYSGTPLDANSAMGKGEKKQLMWVETVRQIVETKTSSLTPQERQLLEHMKDFENIPRKKKKFENFLKNVMKRFIDQRTIDRVWTLLEEHKPVSADNKGTNSSVKEVSKNIPIIGQTLEEKNKEEKVKSKVSEEVVDARVERSENSNENCTDESDLKAQRCERSSNKKRKKNTTSGADDTAESEGIYQEQRASKKRKRKTIEAVDDTMSNLKNIREEEQSHESNEPKEDISKLSKKEKKERKKKDKYEAELKSIAGDQDPSPEDNVFVPKSKKAKKMKNKEKMENGGEMDNEDVKMVGRKAKANVNGEIATQIAAEEQNDGIAVETKCQIEKDVKASLDDGSDKPKRKFKWDKTILSVLQSAPENELLIKRLRKKVLAEFQQSVESGDSHESSLEEALGMFERKLHKIPGVRLHKDRAKLVTNSE